MPFVPDDNEPEITPQAMIPLAPKVPDDFWGDIRFSYRDGKLHTVHIHQSAQARWTS